MSRFEMLLFELMIYSFICFNRIRITAVSIVYVVILQKTASIAMGVHADKYRRVKNVCLCECLH